jgi:transposase
MKENENLEIDFFVGIDMSKGKFDVGILDKSGVKVGHKIFNNNDLGCEGLLTWLTETLKSDKLFFCMEYTGIYSRKLWMYIQDHGCLLWMESGFQIKRKSGIFKTKNDKIDAYRIAEYALFNRHSLKITPDYDENIFVLHDLLANRNRLIDCIKRIQVPLKEIEAHGNKKSIDTIRNINLEAIKALELSLKSIDNQIDVLISLNENWKENIELATSIKGIGKIVCLWVIVYSRNFSQEFNARKFASLAGVAPFEISSGSSINGGFHVNCYSHKQLKGIFHIAAMAAIRFNPQMKEYFDRKKKEGKKGFVAMNNVKNKLIHQMYAVVRNKTPFDSEYIHKKAA